MTSTPSQHSSNAILRVLLDSTLPEPCAWSPDDLRAMLVHMLETPLRLEASAMAAASGEPPARISGIIEQSRCETFGAVLGATEPSTEVLRLIKAFAKSALQPGGRELPKEIARVLYVASILLARESGARGVTALDSADIAREARRILTYVWLPDDLRAQIRRCLSFQGSGPLVVE